MSLNSNSLQQIVPDRSGSTLTRLLGSWELLLFCVGIGVFIFNSYASPYFLDPWNLSDATFNFTEKAMIAFAMTLVIISGEIDLSVASTIALVSTSMGFAVQSGVDTTGLVLTGLLVGMLCGAFNGLLVAYAGLPSIVVTIGTLSLFRGIAYIVLGDKSYSGYPASFSTFGQGYIWWVITYEMIIFLLTAIIFFIVLHKTAFGRYVKAIGNNSTAALFSGIKVPKIKFLLFVITGIMSAVAAICLTSRLGSTRPSIAVGWELEIVTMVVLGGVSILGGSGSIVGVFIAAIIMGMVTFGLGLLNVPGIVMSIFTGLLLICVIALPIIVGRMSKRGAG